MWLMLMLMLMLEPRHHVIGLLHHWLLLYLMLLLHLLLLLHASRKKSTCLLRTVEHLRIDVHVALEGGSCSSLQRK